MSVELYFFINLLADFSLLAATARALGYLRLGRVGAAAALSALFATAARALPMLAGPPVQLAALVCVALFVTRAASLRDAAGFALYLCVNAIVTGTCAAYCRHVPLAVAIAPHVCALSARARRSRLSALPTRLEIVNRGRRLVLQACIDTGNRLTEPLSGQPVLLAHADLLRGVLPEGGYRRVAYGSVGGAGTLKCFRPDRVYIDARGRRRRAPDTWVAILPNRLPGSIQALAPAEYIFH